MQTAGGSGGISSVQVKGPNTAWKGLHNLYGAEWELDTQPQLPLDIHIIADTGAEVSSDACNCCHSMHHLHSSSSAKASVQRTVPVLRSQEDWSLVDRLAAQLALDSRSSVVQRVQAVCWCLATYAL